MILDPLRDVACEAFGWLSGEIRSDMERRQTRGEIEAGVVPWEDRHLLDLVRRMAAALGRELPDWKLESEPAWSRRIPELASEDYE